MLNLDVDDVDNIFPNDHSLAIFEGDDYTFSDLDILPNLNYNGDIFINIIVDDGELVNNQCDIYQLLIDVEPVNDAPELVEIEDQTTFEDMPFEFPKPDAHKSGV